MLKNLGENELEGQVEMQADQYIPFSDGRKSATTIKSWDRRKRTRNKLDVLLVATRTENVEQRPCAV